MVRGRFEPDPSPQPEKGRFSRAEKLLMILALQIVAILGYSYFADIPVWDLFRLKQAQDQSQFPIGTATVVEGQVLRKRANEAAFKPLIESAVIYPNDTVMTGPDSLCIIVLKNGRTIRITANSLVQLTYDMQLSKDGISVDVLRGSVTDDTARMVPMQGTPAPPVVAGPETKGLPPLVVLTLRTVPAGKAALAFSDQEFARRKKPVKVIAKLNRAGGVSFSLYFLEPVTKKRVRVASAAPEISSDLDATLTFEFERPGRYEWEISDEKAKVVAALTIVLPSEVRGLRVLPAFDASDRIEGESSKAAFPGPLLRWAPEAGPGAYKVRLSLPGRASQTVRETLVPELRLDPREVRLDRPMHYSVEKEVDGGFLLSTGLQTLLFDLAPPIPTAPEGSARIEPDRVASQGDLIFFTWTKTNFTTAYEFDLDTKPTFSAPILRRTGKDNFQSLRTPAPGQYYWRVRAKVQNVWTPFSEPRKLKVESQN